MPTSLIARVRRSAIVLVTVAVFLVGLVPAVAAADVLAVTTPYPSIAVAPGSSATFDLTVTSATAGTVALAATGAPSGWKATLHGGGFVVSGVTAAPGKPATARLDVTVPGDATGKAAITVTARLGGQTASLPISVEVSADVAGEITLTTTSPTLTGASDASFNFDLTLNNGSAQDQTVSATATGPAGWTIATKLAAAQAASTVVKAGSSTTITVTATPPPDAPAGKSEIAVTANAGAQTVTQQLGVEITGTYSMTLTTPNQLVSAHGAAGGATVQQIVVTNTGTGPLANVALTATQPTNWKVTFDTDTIPVVQPGAAGAVTVTATITPVGEAVTGDYQVTINAAAPGENGAGAARATLPMTFTVETSPVWLLAGIALIIVILAALFYVFRTYGRR
ncbi:MAG: hypothetical protein QOF49_758 [Chloroflexota bacterium]|nr:hypothetical protein [Chloroflexota bacterium]